MTRGEFAAGIAMLFLSILAGFAMAYTAILVLSCICKMYYLE